jgi:hypothetical protein
VLLLLLLTRAIDNVLRMCVEQCEAHVLAGGLASFVGDIARTPELTHRPHARSARLVHRSREQNNREGPSNIAELFALDVVAFQAVDQVK